MRGGLFSRAPEPLAVAGPHLEPVGIVHLGAPVDRGLLLRLGIPVHRGDGRDAEARDLRAHVERGFDVHDDALAPRHQEAIGADDRGSLHQRIQGQRLSVGSRVDIELGEVGKFLRPVGDRDVERHPAGRKAVLPQFADRAEIGGAEKGDPVVLAPVERPVARFLDPQTGEARPRRQVARRRIGRHFEIGLLVDDLARLAAFDHVHADRLLEKQSEVEEGDREGAGSVGEQGVGVLVFDLSPFLVIDLLQHFRRGPRRRLIRLMRALARLLLEQLVGEADRRLELEPFRLGGESLADRTHRRRGCGDSLEDGSTINALRHGDLFDATRLLARFSPTGEPCIRAPIGSHSNESKVNGSPARPAAPWLHSASDANPARGSANRRRGKPSSGNRAKREIAASVQPA